MSDDSITSFLKSHTTVESEVSPEKSLEKNTQATDFKEIISQEGKKLSSLLSKNEVDNRVESKNSRIGIASIDNPTEAIQSRKEGQVVDVNGNSFPTLSLHNRALAVGRVIYTSREVSVTSESLSKFMVRSGYAFDFKKYSKNKYAKDEKYAKDNKLGFWKTKFEYPWVWRDKVRSNIIKE